MIRSFHHSDFPLERLLERKRESVTVVLPAREVADTIGPIIEQLRMLDPLIDQILVVDAASEDGTADIAARLGAEVHQQGALMPSFGPVLGKGDAMWRALCVTTGDVVCYLDADSQNFGVHFACGMIGPILCEPGVELVKGCFRRPFTVDGVSLPDGGGRVTELTARPLLNLFYPDLSGFRQPLAGEIAARRELFERLPFSTGYAIETALLIDAYRQIGLNALAQVDIGVRQNRHQPLARLAPMAYAVLLAVAERLEREGRLAELDVGDLLVPAEDDLSPTPVQLVERPPMASLPALA